MAVMLLLGLALDPKVQVLGPWLSSPDQRGAPSAGQGTLSRASPCPARFERLDVMHEAHLEKQILHRALSTLLVDRQVLSSTP